MTPRALFSNARAAMKLARECERSSLDYDAGWHAYMMQESQRHRERAAWYLERRALREMEPDLFEAAA